MTNWKTIESAPRDGVTDEMLTAWVSYEPPQINTPFQSLKDAVCLRHAFMSGYIAARAPPPSETE